MIYSRFDRKAMAAYPNLSVGAASNYHAVKQAILRQYQVNAKTHRQQFKQDRKEGCGESYCGWADRLRDCFEKWRKGGEILAEEMILLDSSLLEYQMDWPIGSRRRRQGH